MFWSRCLPARKLTRLKSAEAQAVRRSKAAHAKVSEAYEESQQALGVEEFAPNDSKSQ